jgi:flavorubredoxin
VVVRSLTFWTESLRHGSDRSSGICPMCQRTRPVIVISMNFSPVAPRERVPPAQIGPDTYLVHQVQGAQGEPLCLYLNSMVITGAEPVIVDTGTSTNRTQWLEDVFGIVDPADVRWVYVSHDDIDHTGNLAEVMTACPGAVLVCSWAVIERHANACAFPLGRCRRVNDGDSFEAGDRRLLVVRPPVWDSPTTRGLLDQHTGVYWGADAFACVMPGEAVSTVAELDPEFWADGMALFAHHVLSPWLGLVDQRRFAALCDRTQALGMTTIATAHSPLITDTTIDQAFQLLRDLPATPAPPCPDQQVLDAILHGGAA